MLFTIDGNGFVGSRSLGRPVNYLSVAFELPIAHLKDLTAKNVILLALRFGFAAEAGGIPGKSSLFDSWVDSKSRGGSVQAHQGSNKREFKSLDGPELLTFPGPSQTLMRFSSLKDTS